MKILKLRYNNDEKPIIFSEESWRWIYTNAHFLELLPKTSAPNIMSGAMKVLSTAVTKGVEAFIIPWNAIHHFEIYESEKK